MIRQERFRLNLKRIGRNGAAARWDHDSIIQCEECLALDHVAIDELQRSPETVRECCGLPMRLLPLDECDGVRARRKGRAA